MRKNLGANPYVYPQPVLIVATYGEDGTVDAMNVAYGGIVNSNRFQITWTEKGKLIRRSLRLFPMIRQIIPI